MFAALPKVLVMAFTDFIFFLFLKLQGKLISNVFLRQMFAQLTVYIVLLCTFYSKHLSVVKLVCSQIDI